MGVIRKSSGGKDLFTDHLYFQEFVLLLAVLCCNVNVRAGPFPKNVASQIKSRINRPETLRAVERGAIRVAEYHYAVIICTVPYLFRRIPVDPNGVPAQLCSRHFFSLYDPDNTAVITVTLCYLVPMIATEDYRAAAIECDRSSGVPSSKCLARVESEIGVFSMTHGITIQFRSTCAKVWKIEKCRSRKPERGVPQRRHP